jgi:hypothetical protein
VFSYLAFQGLLNLARKHAQYVGLFVATEDFVVLDLENPDDQRSPMVDEKELNDVVHHAALF